MPSRPVRRLLCLIVIVSGVPARATSPADRARAVVQVVALGAPEFSAKGGTAPLVTLPVRAGYRSLFLEAGVTACVTNLAAPGEAVGWRSGAGFAVRVGGRKRFVEAGAAYADLPAGGGRLRAGEFLVGLVW
ncbi:MAG: hypothetical protein HY906_19100 [Deltaproteobacteria bacterium]|nr:hypothetical protein [Deltaproteobacteria bacterium]